MSTEMNKELLCKDCKYAKADWFTRLTNIGSGFTCTHPTSWHEPEYDPVTGSTTAGFFYTARGMRRSYSECGPAADKWFPSSTKKVFLLLKKD